MITAFLHGLRMAGDLLVYSAFASFFAACLGGQPAPLLVLLPAVCYGVSACFPRCCVLRTAWAAVSLLGLLLAPGWVDRIACLPAVFYVLYLAWKGEYLLSADRQADLFLLFCKAYPVFAIAMSLCWNPIAMLTASLPAAVWAVLLQIFLMRVLRQPPAVHQQPLYLLGNAGLLLGLGGVGLLVSRPAVLGAVQSAVETVYFGVAVPVLTVPLSMLAWAAEHLLMPAITAVLYWIASKSGNRDAASIMSTSGDSITSSRFTPAAQPLLNGSLLLEGAGVILLVAGGIILFRRLLRKGRAPLTGAAPAEVHQTSRRARRRWPSFFLSPNARVRRAYGRYLERQARHGVTREPAETSLDLLGRTPFLNPDAEGQLRRLYLKARYGECATPQDAAAAEQLERELEQPEENRP